MSLSSLQIDQHFAHEPLYAGWRCKDQLKTVKPGGKFWVINMEDYNAGPGTHWMVVVDFTRVPIYVDPFGLPPPPEIVAFMRKSKHGKDAMFSTAQFQAITSENCGWFVLEFISELLKKPDDLEAFDDDLTPYPSTHNEREVRKLKL